MRFYGDPCRSSAKEAERVKSATAENLVLDPIPYPPNQSGTWQSHHPSPSPPLIRSVNHSDHQEESTLATCPSISEGGTHLHPLLPSRMEVMERRYTPLLEDRQLLILMRKR
jgi:hypothetical protein